MTEKMPPRERAAAPKSRGEKSRPPTTAATVASVTAPVNLVAGRLPEAEWLSLLEAERGDRDVGDILAELLGRVMGECAKASAARQCVSFAVGRARAALLRVTRWRFLARDEGETDPEGAGVWREDEEPEPCVTDSWVQGGIPALRVPPSPGKGEVQRGSQDPNVAATAGAAPAQPPHPGRVPSTDTVLPVPEPSHSELLPDPVAFTPRPPEGKPPCARSLPFRGAPRRPDRPPARSPPLHPPRSPHGDTEGTGMTRVSSQGPPLPPPSCTSPVTVQPAQPPHSPGAKQEGVGPILGVPGLGPRIRPQRWIRPQVEVLDPDTEAKPAVWPRWRSRGPELGFSWTSRRQAAAVGTQLGTLHPQPPRPLPQQLGSLLDPARLAPGVTVRRDGSVRRGLCVPARSEEEEMEEAKWDLRPIRPTVPFPALAAGQVSGDGER